MRNGMKHLLGFLGLALFLVGTGLQAQPIEEQEAELKTLFAQKPSQQRTEAIFSWLNEFAHFNQSKENAKKLMPYVRRFHEEGLASKNQHNQGLAWIIFSHFFARLKQYDSAFYYGQNAKSQFEKEAFWLGVAEMKMQLAYLKMNNSDESSILPECREALQLCRQHKLYSSQAKIQSWLGGYFMRIEEPDSARKQFEEVLALPGIHWKYQIYNSFDIGNCFLEKKQFELADRYYKKALALCLQHRFNNILAIIYSSIANLQYVRGNYDSADILMQPVIPLIPTMERMDHRYITYLELMDINAAQKDYPEALRYAQISLAYADSVNLENNQTQYRELEEKYQSKLKDQTIREKEDKLKQEEQRRFWLILGILALVVIAGLTVVLIWLNRRRKESRLQQQISESEMKALRAQMNPHFMFNSLNAIQQMVLNSENDNAFRYLDTYSKLTRSMLENSGKPWITLKEEIRFLKLYLEMESLRFDHAFSWELEVDEELSLHTDRIPSMVVQPLAENAIKHGLIPLEGEGRLWIRFIQQGDFLKVEVEDNGVGRRAGGANPETHQSMSGSITETRLRLFNQRNETQLQFEDLTDANGKPCGTKVWFLVQE